MTITITVAELGDHMLSQQIDDPVRAFREVAYNKVWPTSKQLPQVVRNWVENENFINEHFIGAVGKTIEIEVPEDIA